MTTKKNQAELIQGFCPLYEFSWIAISGNNAASFLQGQLTCDVGALENNHATLFACCDHKVRMQFNGWLCKLDNHYYFYLPTSIANIACEHLHRFAMLSRVRVARIEPDWSAVDVVSHEKHIAPNIISTAAPASHNDWKAFAKTRQLLIADSETLTSFLTQLSETHTKISENDWHLLNLQSHLVYLTPETSQAFIPQMTHLDKLGGVSFDKGCYVGQEVIARTHHLGKLKRHLCHGHIDNGTLDLQGTELLTGEQKSAGHICTVAMLDTQTLAFNAVVHDHYREQPLQTKSGLAITLHD